MFLFPYLLIYLAGINASSFPDGKIPKDYEGLSSLDYEKVKMENFL